jgi:hypothetical protein
VCALSPCADSSSVAPRSPCIVCPGTRGMGLWGYTMVSCGWPPGGSATYLEDEDTESDVTFRGIWVLVACSLHVTMGLDSIRWYCNELG